MAKGKGGFLGQDGLNAPDQATGVSATAGDESATVSFTAPSDTGSSDITGYQVQSNNGDGTYYSSYDIENASDDDLSSNFTSKDSDVRNFNFSADGSYLFIPGGFTDTVYRYSLATPWDLTTVTDDSNSKDTSAQATSAMDVWFKPDGTIMYVSDNNTSAIYQYTLSTAYDLSTASYASKSLSTSSQGLYVRGMAINDDGTKFYAFSSNDNTIYQYNATSAYDISTASYASKSFNPSSDAPAPSGGISFNSDGTELFVGGASADSIYKFDLSTAYDISTASYSGVSFAVGNSILTPHCVRFGNSGTKMFVIDSTSDTVFQYTSGLNDYPTSSPVTITGLTNDTSYTFNVWAINSSGWSAPSDASDAVTPLAPAWVFFSGGSNSNSMVQRVNALSAGNSTDFGDMIHGGGNNACGFGSTTRGFQAQGFLTNVIEFVLFASGGNSTDFGDGQYSSLTYAAGISNSTRGIIAGGNQTGNQRNRIQYVTMASAGNAATFGNLLASCSQFAECASTTRGVFMGDNSNRTRMQYITIASTGNALSFGSLSTDQDFGCGFSNSTRGVVNCGDGGVGNVMEYITIASTGNSTDFGDLYVKARARPGGMAGGNIGLIAGGYNNDASSQTNVIQSVTIPTTGNSIDFGDLVSNSTELAASGNAHGGIS